MVLTATSRSAILYTDFLDCDLEFATAKVPYCQLDQITVHDGQFITLICLSVTLKLIWSISRWKNEVSFERLKSLFLFNFWNNDIFSTDPNRAPFKQFCSVPRMLSKWRHNTTKFRSRSLFAICVGFHGEWKRVLSQVLHQWDRNR